MSRGPRWTLREEAILRRDYAEFGPEGVAMLLPDRTKGAIIARAFEFKLTRPASNGHQRYRKRPAEPAPPVFFHNDPLPRMAVVTSRPLRWSL